MTFYSTKYWSTCGIETFEGSQNDGYASAGIPGRLQGYRFERVGRDAFLTREEAVANANEKRKRKLAALRKQITKLEAMDFGATP